MSNTRPNVFIFRQLKGLAAEEILINESKKKPNTTHWLIRESYYTGMLVYQSINERGKTDLGRYCLTDKGWELVFLDADKHPEQNIKVMIQKMIRGINAFQTGDKDVLDLLNKLAEKGLTVENRINPAPEQASIKKAYSDYAVDMVKSHSLSNVDPEVSLKLLPEIQTFILCSRRREVMVDPMVFNGQCYDRSSLTEAELSQAYPNLQLKQIIKYITAGFNLINKYPDLARDQWDKIENQMKDASTKELMSNTLILLSPDGYSYKQATIRLLPKNQKGQIQDPITGKMFSLTRYVLNHNLERLIANWSVFDKKTKNLLSAASAAGYATQNKDNLIILEKSTFFASKALENQEVLFKGKVTEHADCQDKLISIILPKKIAKLLTCPLSHKLMRDPRVLNKIWYDSSSLKKEELQIAYRDLNMRNIIERILDCFFSLQKGQAGLAKKRWDDITKEMEDPIMLSKMSTVVLSPCGHSYDYETFLRLIDGQHDTIKDPMTRQSVKITDFVSEGVLLTKLISLWEPFEKEIDQKLDEVIEEEEKKKNPDEAKSREIKEQVIIPIPTNLHSHLQSYTFFCTNRTISNEENLERNRVNQYLPSFPGAYHES